MSPRRIRRSILAVAALAALAVLLGGCTWLKPGTYKVTQPGGTGPVKVQFTVCTMFFSEEAAMKEENPFNCGPVNKQGQGQILVTLMVPVGTAAPATLAVTPGPGAGATSLARSPELAAQMNAFEVSAGQVGPPAGFEMIGYVSGTVADSAAQELTWAIEGSLGLPQGAGGGSYGGPYKATAMVGWRSVSAEHPASRPITCFENLETVETNCGAAEPNGEATLGVSDLKIAPPPPANVVPGAKVKLPFVLDLASSAAELPKFKLAAASNLSGAVLGLSNPTFTRAPSDPATNRAPATTRKVIVTVPLTARLGRYELNFTATTAQGGQTAATTAIAVRPKGRALVSVPRRVRARIASSRGIPVQLTAPIAGTRFLVVLKGPRPNGRGRVRFLRRVSTARPARLDDPAPADFPGAGAGRSRRRGGAPARGAGLPARKPQAEAARADGETALKGALLCEPRQTWLSSQSRRVAAGL